jgi:hypothetical protein
MLISPSPNLSSLGLTNICQKDLIHVSAWGGGDFNHQEHASDIKDSYTQEPDFRDLHGPFSMQTEKGSSSEPKNFAT